MTPEKRYTSLDSWRPGFVYRCYDADGTLLYIGATTSVAQRMGQHKRTSLWWPVVDRVDVSEPFEHRWQAMAAERAAIVAEQPRFNVRTDYLAEAVG